MSTRVERLRARRRAESAARFQAMLARLEKEWLDQLKIKPGTAPTGRATGKHEPLKEQENKHDQL